MNTSKGGIKRLLAVIIPLLVIIFVFFGSIANYIVDYQWFKELNYTEVFFKKLLTQIKFFVPTMIGLFILIYTFIRSINAHSAKRSGAILSIEEKRLRSRVMIIISIGTSLLLSILFVNQIWYDFLIFINKNNFNIADPVFSKDIGFYIFTLPFLDKVYSFLLGLVMILALITVAYNLLFGLTAKQPPRAIHEENVTNLFTPKAVYTNILEAAYKQLAILGAAFFTILAFGFYLRTFQLLYSSRGIAYGAGYTDIRVSLPSYYVYAAISLLSAVLILFSSIKKKVRFAAFGPILLIVAIVGSGLISGTVQNVIVTPNELSKEEQYLQHNIDYTNYAYGLDKVAIKQFDVAQNLTRKDIDNNKITIGNIPVNDYKPAKDIYNQIQGLKTYYAFNDLDIDRYMIDGVYRQVFTSARELKGENIPKQSGEASASWINKYLKYTHGYGVVMSPVNEVTPSGQPRLLIKDMPINSAIDIKVDRPQIYFGEKTSGFVIVNSREKEFDYPTSDINIESEYTGKGGIKLNFLNKILFAVREGNMNFLLSQDITANSKVIINRDIITRVQKIAPFLIFDEDPYVVTSEGKLYWIIDAFTTSNRYPYSEPINEQTTTNYIRNSVKVVIDAYDGTVDFYIADKNDPLAQTYSNVFKTLFKPLDEMPADLRSHIRYPQTMFDIQSNIYKKYHIKQARELYNKSDIWDIATQIYGSTGAEAQVVESTYLIMKLPDTEKEEFLLMIPYTPQSKTNMISWLAVKNDGENYGQMILYRFPSGKTIEGPMQVEGIVSQDVAYSNTMNLLTTGGNAQIIRGNMMVIPIEDSVLYVEPIYVRANNATALPEVKKVILFYKNQVVLEDTLEKGLNKMFPLPNGGTPKPQPQDPVETGTDTSAQLIIRANTIFAEAQNALKAGNWTEYGSKITELEGILEKLNQMSGAAAKPEAPVTPLVPIVQ